MTLSPLLPKARHVASVKGARSLTRVQTRVFCSPGISSRPATTSSARSRKTAVHQGSESTATISSRRRYRRGATFIELRMMGRFCRCMRRRPFSGSNARADRRHRRCTRQLHTRKPPFNIDARVSPSGWNGSFAFVAEAADKTDFVLMMCSSRSRKAYLGTNLIHPAKPEMARNPLNNPAAMPQ
jgi:hypothetical protein